jgi:fructose-specific phosphotransferase system IIA component
MLTLSFITNLNLKTCLVIETTRNKEGDKKMQITKFLTKENVILDIKSRNKTGVIKEIASTLKNSDKLKDYDKLLKDISVREKLNTTGIGNFVAIPHARTDAVDNFIIAFGRSKKGVNFNSIDKKPAKFIAVMGTPKNKGLNEYLQLLAHLTRLLNKSSFQKSLLEAKNQQDIVNLFKR